jgi:predicted RNA-binding Zn ribbon-like protein
MSSRLKVEVETILVPMDTSSMGGRRRGQSSTDFEFGTGSLCLDFAATLDGQGDDALDLLATPDRLGQWLRSPGLPVPVGGLIERDLLAAKALRASVIGAARATIAHEDVSVVDVRCINSFARLPTPVFLLQTGGRDRTMIEETDAAAALSVIARDAVHMVTGTDSSRLRECARPGCSTLFFDRSPSGRRRWCSMKGCGEMVASASYRRRRTSGTPS